jgi:hypothetical protein
VIKKTGLSLLILFCLLHLNAHAADQLIKEGMDKVEDWHVDMDAGAQAQLKAAAGKEGQALALDFDFAQSQWVQVWKRIELNLSDAQYFKIIFQGTGGGNNLQIKLVDQDGSTYGVTLEGMVPAEQWTEMEIPLVNFQHFWGGDDKFNKDSLRKIYIGLTRADGGKGTFLVDGIQFSKNPTGQSGGGASGASLDMETSSGYTAGGESGSATTLNVVEGHSGKGLQVQYDFGTGTWLQIQKNVQWNIKPYNHLVFWYKASGAVNNLQVKIVDRDGSTFGATFEGVAPSEDWIEAKLPLNELNYFWGGDAALDATDVRKFFFAVTKNEGGAGTVEVDELKFVNIAIAQEQADRPKIKIEKEYKVEGLDTAVYVENVLQAFTKNHPIGYRTAWGGVTSSISEAVVPESGIKKSDDATLENVLLLAEIALKKQNRTEVNNLLKLVFSENYFWNKEGKCPVWLVDSEGNKKSVSASGAVYLCPSAELFRLTRVLNQAEAYVGQEMSKQWAQQIVDALNALKKENLVLPLGAVKENKLEPAQSRKTYLGVQDLTACLLISKWLAKEDFLGIAEKAVEVIKEDASPFGLVSDQILWGENGIQTVQDPAHHEHFLFNQLKIAISLAEYARETENPALDKRPKKLLKFLIKNYSADGKIITSYDSATGAALCNFESLMVYAQAVRLALAYQNLAFAETLIREKIVPSFVNEGALHGLFLDSRSGKAWAFDQLQVILALLEYQTSLKSSEGKYESFTQKPAAKKFLEKPFDVIDIYDFLDMDAISELGKSEGNFDGVGFSFGATSFGPSHTFFMCLEKDMVFLVPLKEGQGNNVVQCAAQEIEIQPGHYSKVHLLVSAHHGNVSDFMQLKYMDGSTERLPFSAGDWWHAPKLGHISRACDLVQNGQKIRDRKVNLFHIEAPADPEKILKSVILPPNGKAVVFSMTAEKKES